MSKVHLNKAALLTRKAIRDGLIEPERIADLQSPRWPAARLPPVSNALKRPTAPFDPAATLDDLRTFVLEQGC